MRAGWKRGLPAIGPQSLPHPSIPSGAQTLQVAKGPLQAAAPRWTELQAPCCEAGDGPGNQHNMHVSVRLLFAGHYKAPLNLRAAERVALIAWQRKWQECMTGMSRAHLNKLLQ